MAPSGVGGKKAEARKEEAKNKLGIQAVDCALLELGLVGPGPLQNQSLRQSMLKLKAAWPGSKCKTQPGGAWGRTPTCTPTLPVPAKVTRPLKVLR